ncbi:hypothetical protein [Ochrobactrum chromiisoli]|uniref:Uncharacterized protein n=1 Tax=Ochrobactrum chromiisoli TaxID=2993941 RepID=A0ABT3QUK0_9HYPH|nr:hypothetical protein [Ochrobactrum chromiisoli]MCX2699289.1 hypothetical protein [Ochrobactrum chromiisoli]
MAVPYHTHTFELKSATKDDVVTGVRDDLSLTPASVGSAAAKEVEYFATATQGTKADNAVQPDDLSDVAISGQYDDLVGKPSLGSVSVTSYPPVPSGKILNDKGEWIEAPEMGLFNHDTLAQANADLANIPNNGGVNIVADGLNNGFYVKQGGILVKKSDATLSSLDVRVSGVSEAFSIQTEQPNLLSMDEVLFNDLSRWLTVPLPPTKQIFSRSGHPSDQQAVGVITANVGQNRTATFSISRSSFSGARFSASVRLAAADAAPDTPGGSGVNRFMIQQMNSANAEIANTRQSVAMFGAAGADGPLDFGFGDIELDPACQSIRLIFELNAIGSTAGAARNMAIQRILIANGSSWAWRPPAAVAASSLDAATGSGNGYMTPPLTASVMSKANLYEVFQPNLLTIEDIATLSGPHFTVTGSSTTPTEKVSIAGIPAFKITCDPGKSRSAIWKLPKGAFDPSLPPAVAVQFYSVDATVGGSGQVRLLKRQLNGTTEISAVRESAVLVGAGALPPDSERAATRLQQNGWDASATFVELYVDITNTGTEPRSVIVSAPIMASGDATFRGPAVSSTGGNSPVIYADPAGNDAAAGTSITPKKTIQAAIDAAAPSGTVILSGGDYSDTVLNLANAYGLKIYARNHARPVIVGGTKLTGITKSSGYTKVYQATVSSALATYLSTEQANADNSPKTWIFQRGVADPTTAIVASERHPLHRGQTHRLADICRIWNVASIAAIDSASRASWFISGTTVYFSIDGGGSAIAADIYIPSSSAISGLNGTQAVRIHGLETRFVGLPFDNAAVLDLYGVRCLGARGEGITFDETQHARIEHCEAGACGQDGFNNHTYASSPYRSNYQVSELWSHDNGDDGRSPHEYCEGSDWNSLYEYNFDRGVIVSYGAHEQANFCMTRNNGWGVTVGGEGFVASGGGTEGVDTSLITRGCIAIGNRRNFAASVDATAHHIVIDGVSIDPVTAHYSGIQGGRLEYLRCDTSGAGTVKETSGGGSVTAIAALTRVP